MTITFDPQIITFAVVEYLQTSNHIYQAVAANPTQNQQYRIVFFTANVADANLAVSLLSLENDVTNDRYRYSVAPAVSDNEKSPLVLSRKFRK